MTKKNAVGSRHWSGAKVQKSCSVFKNLHKKTGLAPVNEFQISTKKTVIASVYDFEKSTKKDGIGFSI